MTIKDLLLTLKNGKEENKIESIIAQTEQLFPDNVDSSFIETEKYNSVTKTLELNLDGKKYLYLNVSQELYDGFNRASSKGKYLNTVIKNGFHPFVRL
jgi:hypothetical protein